VVTDIGGVDVLVTCATYIDFTPDGSIVSEFVSMNWDSLERHIVVNCMSTPLLLKLLLPGMVERRRGLVVNVTQNCFWLGRSGLPMPGNGICGAGIPMTRGLTDRIAPALARELEPHGVTILTFDPGMTLAQDSVRFPTIMATGYVPEAAHSVLVPARAVSHLATCRDPSRFNGKLVIALDLVREVGLLTEEEIMPDWHDGVQDVTAVPPIAAESIA
jgi:NAD(P)-dependent dehydrogenase (short-subunit alcohol dehydrogenase family)